MYVIFNIWYSTPLNSYHECFTRILTIYLKVYKLRIEKFALQKLFISFLIYSQTWCRILMNSLLLSRGNKLSEKTQGVHYLNCISAIETVAVALLTKL